MPTEAKEAAVAELRQQLQANRTLIVSEYRGLTVREIQEIRRSLRKQDVTYRVIKNRLMKIAAADTVGSALDPLLSGPTAIAFGNDEGATAKAVIDTMRPYRTVKITGALLGDRAIDADVGDDVASHRWPGDAVELGQAADVQLQLGIDRGQHADAGARHRQSIIA